MRVRIAILVWAAGATLHGGAIFNTATSSTIAGLQPAIDAFRASIGGGSVAGPAGSFGGVRREINWDGVPDNLADPNLMPGNFFIVNSPRGLELTGSNFILSANPGQPSPSLFESFDGAAQGNGTYAFQAFSANRLFSSEGSTDYDINFFVPGTGTATPSFTLAFGIIFVDNTNSTFPGCASLQLFNGNTPIGGQCAAPTTSGGFSFLSVVATGADVITRITVHQGNAILGTPQDGTHDVVVADDFIYAEPGLASLSGSTIPEPSYIVLTALGLGAAAAFRHQRRVLPLVLMAILSSSAIRAGENSRVVAKTIGQYESANSAVYSVYLATKQEALGSVLVSTWLPPGARFLENVDLPPGTVFEGVADNVVQWSVEKLDADTLLGPLTFRIKFDPSKVSIPVAPPFSVLYQRPVLELLEDSGAGEPLTVLAEQGVITFDQRGTLDGDKRNTLVDVGKTGIQVYVPEGAVDRSVTLTFKRIPVTDTLVPQDVAPGTWWCGIYQVTVEPQVTFAKPLFYALPARRPLPPGLPVIAFTSTDQSSWKEAGGDGEVRPHIGFGFGGGFQTCTTIQFMTVCRFGGFGGGFGFGGFGAFGIADRASRGVITGSALSQQFGTSVSPAHIVDGTSNTIIAILIGLR